MVHQLKANPIIGLVGFDCSGKGTVAGYLREQHGFQYYSLSDVIREEANSRGLDHQTETLIALGKELREKHGNAVLAERTLKRLQSNTRYVIDSIRLPEEITSLRSKVRFSLVAIHAPLYERFKRFNARQREGEQINLEQFAERDSRAFYTADAGQKVGFCIPMASHHITNVGTEEALYSQVDDILRTLERPDWDEYFLRIMEVVARRGTCDRGMAGAVIVKDKQILATGYVGAPAGLPHCDEVGHLLEERKNEDGSYSQHCIRTAHAEQNALTQAAKHGVDVGGGTLYVSFEPCRDCTKLVINSGIEKVVARRRYQKGELAREWLKKAGIELEVLEEVVQKY